MEKSAEAFRTISEVAETLQIPAHVLRFWESRFPQIKPIKRAGGRRYYRPSDIALLSGIRKLLHDDGLTIRGVQKILREQGVRRVAEMGSAEEAGFVELETPDEPVTAEVHPFPARTTVAPNEADWSFQPSTPDEEATDFFGSSVVDDTDGDEAPAAPLTPADAGTARARAERMVQQPMPEQPYDLPKGHISSTDESQTLPQRLRALEEGRLQAADLLPIVERLLALRQRMLASFQ